MHASSPAITSITINGFSRIVRCWELVLRFSRGTFRFTEHSHPLIVDGQTFTPANGVDVGTLSSESNTSPSNAGVRGVITTSVITDKMLAEGALNGAEVTEFLVDWRYPHAGKFRVMTYDVSGTKWNPQTKRFECDLAGLVERLKSNVGNVLSQLCPYDLGDARCGVNLAPFTSTGSIGAVNSATSFSTTLSPARAADLLIDGRLTWTSGPNAGILSTVKTWDGSVAKLHTPPPSPIAVGHAFSVTPGCNKSFGVDEFGVVDEGGNCIHRFNNGARFGGSPFAPTVDRLYLTPYKGEEEE